MTQTAQISCINKDPRYDPYRRITHVGGYTTERWKITLDNAIAHIQSREWAFYTLVGGHHQEVEVATRLGRRYLKTKADRDTPDNLLSLPECP